MNKLFADEVSVQATSASASPERHAALMLHAMGERDRSWALEQLQPIERNRIAPLLEELRELGVPADRRWIAQALDSVPAALDSPRARIAGASADRVAQALMGEPAALVQRVFALGSWPWHDEVLASLRARRGELFEPAAGADSLAAPARPALDAALLGRLAARVGEAPVAHPARVSVEGAWARWRGRLGRWQGRAR